MVHVKLLLLLMAGRSVLIGLLEGQPSGTMISPGSSGAMRNIIRTSHSYLKVSKSTNSFATVSSDMIALYCFKSLSHVSVYSASGIASFLCAFSNSSNVIIILKTSANES